MTKMLALLALLAAFATPAFADNVDFGEPPLEDPPIGADGEPPPRPVPPPPLEGPGDEDPTGGAVEKRLRDR